MSLIDRNGRPLTASAIAPVASIGATISPYYAGKPRWPTGTPENLRREAYEKLSLIWRCVQYTANSAGQSGVTLRVYDQVNGKDEAIDDHPLRLLMKQPNAQMREGRFLSFVTMVATTSNVCVIEKVRSAAGRVVALEPLYTDWLRPILRNQASPDWEYRVPGIAQPFVLPATDVLVFPYADRPDMLLHPTGTGPVESCFREAGLLNVMTDFLKVFFDRGAMPVYALLVESVPGMAPLSQAEKDTMTESFVMRHGGLEKAAVPVIAEGIKGVERLSFDFDELALTDIRDMSDIAICQAFGVDPALVGARVGMEHSDSRANATEASRKFYRDTMIPLWNRLDEVLTLGLLPEFETLPTTRELAFDYSDVHALAPDRDARASWLGVAVQGGYLSQHTFMDEMELPIPETPDFYLRGLAVQAIPADDPLGIAAQEAADAKAAEQAKIAADAAAKAAQQAPDPNAEPAKPPKDKPMAAGDRPRLRFGRRTFAADGSATTDVEHPGLFLGLFLPIEQATQLAIEGGEPAEMLHVTLVYDTDAELDDVAFAHLVAAVDDACGAFEPLTGSISGHGRFYGPDTGDPDVFYAIPNLPGLTELRTALLGALQEVGLSTEEDEFSFSPHITLAYLDEGAADPTNDVATIALWLGAITASYGDKSVVIPLNGPDDGVTMGSGGPKVTLVGVPPSEQYAVRAKIGASNRAMVNRIGNVGEKLMKTYFRQMGDRIVKAVEAPHGVDAYAALVALGKPAGPLVMANGLTANGKVPLVIHRFGPSDALTVANINWDHEEKQLATAINKIHSLAGDTAAANTSTQTGVSIAWDLANPHVRKVMDRLAGNVVGINQTSKDAIAELVTQAAEAGKSRSELADDLRGLFSAWTSGRASTVARTEAMTSYGLASAAGYRMSGIVDRIQCFDNENHTDDYGAEDGLSCAERDGLIDDLDSADLHIESEHPNGSLAIAPVLKGAS